MKMKQNFCVLALGSALIAAMNVQAIPTLQLDASPATYDSASSSTISTAPNFTLYALLNSLTPTAGDTYEIVAALEPATSTPATLGSFVFNGTTIHATSDMTYGNPAGLPPHGIYATYFKVFTFTWNPANTFNDYDAAAVTGVHSGPGTTTPGNALYMAFNVDVNGLAPGYTLWFDLAEYNSQGYLVNKAPFSHAAQADLTGRSVPDTGSTVALLGSAMAGLAFIRAKFRRN
jgi:hypothetical protein